jgi:hypothetical protein
MVGLFALWLTGAVIYIALMAMELLRGADVRSIIKVEYSKLTIFSNVFSTIFYTYTFIVVMVSVIIGIISIFIFFCNILS